VLIFDDDNLTLERQTVALLGGLWCGYTERTIMSNNPYYEQDTLFITGFAGSGKSTELVKRATPKTLVLVPTHKAADVLIGKGLENVYTIHAVLKLVPSINENFRRKMTTKLTKVGSTDLSNITDVFIDEFSMVNEEILNILMEALPEKCKVTIFGDPYQLPPVKGTPIAPWEPIIELTTQHRSKNPKGTALFMAFMKSIRDNTKAPSIKHEPKGYLKGFNPDTDRILAYTNEKMIELNNEVAQNAPLEAGDEIVMNGIPATVAEPDIISPFIYPTCITKGKLLEGSKLWTAAAKSTTEIAKWNTDLSSYKELYVDDYMIYYDLDHYATTKKLKADVEKWQRYIVETHNIGSDVNLPRWCRQNRSKQGVKERGRAWSRYLAHTSYVFSVTRPYCTTVHKAQGSEFSMVFIARDDLRKAKRFDEEQYKRLMYVALSRAIDGIIFI